MLLHSAAAVMGYFLWDEVPGLNTLIGMVLIVGSGLYIGYREVLNAGDRDTPVPTGEVSFAPSAPIGAVVHAGDTQDFPQD